MKKYIFLAFGLLLAMNMGCILITVIYPTIIDSSGVSGAGQVVNTNGKAHIRETGQTIGFLPNGDNGELVAFVNQGADGGHQLTAYQITTSGDPYSHFHSDTYCNPDWTGCSFYSATYQSDIEFTGIFGTTGGTNGHPTPTYSIPNPDCTWAALGGRFNFNCVDLGFVGLCTTYRNAECGRGMIPKKMNLSTLYTLLGAGQPVITRNGLEGLKYNLNRETTSISLITNGETQDFNLTGNISALVVPANGRVFTSFTDPSMRRNLLSAASMLKSTSGPMAMRVTFEGVSEVFNIDARGNKFAELAAKQY